MPLRVLLAGFLLSGLAFGGSVLTTGPLDRATFARHVRLHVSGVDRITRVWWNLFHRRVFPDASPKHEALLLDLLGELGRLHDVSKWGTRFRTESAFRDEFDRLEALLDRLHGRSTGHPVTMGSDLLSDLASVNFSDDSLPKEVFDAAQSVRALLNRIDALATQELLGSKKYVALAASEAGKLVGAVSLADLTHRFLASRGEDSAFGRKWRAATRIEFGRALHPGSDFLVVLKADGKPLPGIAEAEHFPIDEAIDQIRELEGNSLVREIVSATSLLLAEPSCGGALRRGFLFSLAP